MSNERATVSGRSSYSKHARSAVPTLVAKQFVMQVTFTSELAVLAPSSAASNGALSAKRHIGPLACYSRAAAAFVAQASS